ncbi:cytochrome P450 [Myxococcota bacterium]|nr:cytochrome P450 [Myxococcota bacterium]
MTLYDPYVPQDDEKLYDTYRVLRDEHPVYHNSQRSFYALSRHEDIWKSLVETSSFSSVGMRTAQGLLPYMIAMDDPDHRRLRNLVSRAFTPRRVDELEPSIRAHARSCLDSLSADGGGDLLSRFASQIPSFAIGEMIGLPESKRSMFLEWTESMVPLQPRQSAEIADTAQSMYQEFSALFEERRTEPQDDLMSALISAEIDGEKLTEEELLGFCFLLIVGGNDTTTNLIGNGAVLLARHPEQREMIVENPNLLRNAIEEMMRIESPTQNQHRVPTRDLEIHGVKIPAGSDVMQLLGSANHDERIFPEPEQFDITRDTGHHLALGHGVHFCLGGNLARLEARIAFEELLDRAPAYTLDGSAPWQPSRWARAHREIPVVLG